MEYVIKQYSFINVNHFYGFQFYLIILERMLFFTLQVHKLQKNVHKQMLHQDVLREEVKPPLLIMKPPLGGETDSVI